MIHQLDSSAARWLGGGILAVTALLAVPGLRGRAHAVASAGRPTLIALENAKPGTPGWLGPAATGRAIEVYASATDALPGDSVDVHVSTSTPARYRVIVYRLGWYGGVGAREVACLPTCRTTKLGHPRPVPLPESDGRVRADWPITGELRVGDDWVSGYYLIRARLLSGPQAGSDATTYLVVRSPRRSSAMLVQVPVNTWQAYNGWGGKSLYPFSSNDGRQAIRVSFDRPYQWDLPGGQGPLTWELPLVRFIERNGYDVAYQSDVATARDPASLWLHRLIVVAGHDEYWTKSMRDAFDAARTFGVNLAFMGANDVYWRVRYQNSLGLWSDWSDLATFATRSGTIIRTVTMRTGL